MLSQTDTPPCAELNFRVGNQSQPDRDTGDIAGSDVIHSNLLS
jgi:hypothetical protein